MIINIIENFEIYKSKSLKYFEIYDEIITITNDEAFKYGKKFSQVEGVLIGISSGAALAAATKIAQRSENKDKTIVVLLPDTGERYLSTPLFNN